MWFEPDFSVRNVLLPETQHKHNNNSTQRHTGVDRAGTLLGPVCCYPQVWLFEILFMHISTLFAEERNFKAFFYCSSHFRPAYKRNQSLSCNNV